MPVDSQVVNARFVGTDRSDVTSLEIDQGRVVSVNDGVEAWRTVDASGYFVLPGAIQMSDTGIAGALGMVLQGVTSFVAPVECDPRELPDQIQRLQSDSILDFAICWTPPPEVTPDDIRSARDHDIHIFDLSVVEPNQQLLNEFADATVRVPMRSPYVDGWLGSPDSTRIVLTQVDEGGLASAQDAKASRDTGVFLESALAALGQDEELWEATASGKVDLISHAGSDGGMLQTLYAEGVVRRGLSMSRLVELYANAPASAYGLSPKKGTLNPGSDADFVVFDPDQMSTLDEVEVPGRVVYAQLRGDILLFNGELHLAPGDGQLL